MAKLKDGFYKQTAETVGSDLFVLLAGGGMKPLADFATSTLDGVATEDWVSKNYLALSGGSMTGPLIIKKAMVSEHWGAITLKYDGGWSGHRNYIAGINVEDSQGIVGRFGITYDGGYGKFVVRGLYNSGYDKSDEVFSVNANGVLHASEIYESGVRVLTSLPSHTHSYLPLAGGLMTDAATIQWGNNKTTWDSVPNGFIGISNLSADSTLGYYAGLSFKGYYGMQFRNYGGGNSIEFRGHDSSNWQPWVTIITSSNYNSYSPTLAGVGATGTWGINISGSANTATSSTSSSYSRSLLGRTTSGTDYSAVAGNLIFAEWNTHSDSRWYLKADGYETRVGYANNSDKLDGIDSTGFLRKVTVANNATNDFNTFESMTLTGRGDPTTGASLSNAPWSGSGPAGGYGVLTYLWSGYGTQMAWGYNSNRIYIRPRYYSNGGVWSTTWDSLALTSDLKNPTDYYWANVPISATSSTSTSPTFGSVTSAGPIVSNTYHQIYNSGSYVNCAANRTGAIVIQLPITSGQYDMINMEISVYEYESSSASKIIVGGHPWDSKWYHYSCSIIGGYNKGVRLGVYDGKYCVILGNSSTVWQYPGVFVTHIGTVYDTYSNAYANKCTISLVTSESGFSALSTPTNIVKATHALDAGNNNPITFHYSTGGFSSNPSRLAAWNGYDLTYVSPSVLSVSYASSAGNADTVDYLHASDFARSRGSDLLPTDINHLGYGYAHNGWGYYGPAFTFGVSSYYARIQKDADSNRLYVSSWVNSSTNTDWSAIAFLTDNVASATYATNSTYLYASDSPYRYGDSAPYYMRMRYNVNGDSRWYLSVYPETPKTVAVDHAYISDRAWRLHGHSCNPDNSHPGHGAQVFYSWDTGQAGNSSAGYSNGITIGSHVNDQAYGFQIVQNMWDDRTYTRRYSGGWQSWKTLAWTSDIPTVTDYYWADQRITSSAVYTASPTLSTLRVQGSGGGRANIYMVSASDVPNDLWFGAGGQSDWSLTSRSSSEGRYFGLYNNSSGWAFTVDKSNNRFKVSEWIQFESSAGLYWPNAYGAHFYPNNTSSYGQFKLLGDKNGYSGIHFGSNVGYLTLMDNGSDKGAYQENWGWLWYFNARNGKYHIRTSSDLGGDINLNGVTVIKGGSNGGSTDSWRFKIIQGTDNGSGIYDTAIISSNDVASLRISESDGSQLGLCGGDGNATLTSTNTFRFYTNCGVNQAIYSGGAGTFRFGLNYGGYPVYMSGVAYCDSYIRAAGGYVHPSYWSSAYALTSDGGAAYIPHMRVSNADMVDDLHASDFARSYTLVTSTQRDFGSGTLIKTDIWYNDWSGNPFYGEIKGNVYGSLWTACTQFQGYIYDNTIINYGVMHMSAMHVGDILAMNIDGYLCFWFPRLGYWHGYSIKVTTGYDYNTNRVVGVYDSGDPGGSKRVNLSGYTRYTITNDNIGSQSVNYANSAYSCTYASNLYSGASASDIYNSGWYRNYNTAGMYNQTYGAHWYFDSSYWRADKNIIAPGFYQDSDETLKNFYGDIKVNLEELKTIPKKYFTFKDNPDKIEIGTSAQAVQKLYPEIVSQNDAGKLSVAYDKLAVIALKGIDELYDMILELKEENRLLKEELKQVKTWQS